MIKLIDVTYHSNTEFDVPAELLHAQKESLGYIDFTKGLFNIQVVKHMNYEGTETINGTKFSFFKSINRFFYIPFRTNNFIRSEAPDVVLVQGLIFPLQVIFLRFAVGSKCFIIVQHHGELPFTGIKKVFQKLADKCVDRYLFTAEGNAKKWIDSKIISDSGKCREVLEASTFMTRQDKQKSRDRCGIQGMDIYLWVGRLEANKDPVTVLAGFEKYLEVNSHARLYMIYQENDLLTEVKHQIDKSKLLKGAVRLVGKIDHDELPYWFSAANYYLSGSHREGSGYALIEAMACGCIPVVTDIPPFRKMAGRHGFFFEPGNPDSMYDVLCQLPAVSKETLHTSAVNHFNDELSFQKIADDIFKICKQLTTE